MAEVIGNADNRMGGHPTGNTDNQAAQVKTCNLCISGISSLVSGIVDDQTAINNALNLGLQSSKSLVVLHLQTLDGGIDLTEAYITDQILHIQTLLVN
jgi:hypothetical protein